MNHYRWMSESSPKTEVNSPCPDVSPSKAVIWGIGIGIILGLLNWIAGPSIIGIFLGAWFGVLLGNFILKFDC